MSGQLEDPLLSDSPGWVSATCINPQSPIIVVDWREFSSLGNSY